MASGPPLVPLGHQIRALPVASKHWLWTPGMCARGSRALGREVPCPRYSGRLPTCAWQARHRLLGHSRLTAAVYIVAAPFTCVRGLLRTCTISSPLRMVPRPMRGPTHGDPCHEQQPTAGNLEAL